MNIGIIGAGNIGATLARLLSASGHAVKLAARDPSKLGPLLAELGPGASAGSPDEAAAFGEAIVVAAPYGAWPGLGRDLSAALAGKVVIDAANPLPERDGAMAEAALAAGSGQATATYARGARIVKAFNTLYWKDLAGKGGQGLAMAIAGDDESAVELTSGLVRDAGFEPHVAGGLEQTWRFDPGQPAYAATLTASALAAALAEARRPSSA